MRGQSDACVAYVKLSTYVFEMSAPVDSIPFHSLLKYGRDFLWEFVNKDHLLDQWCDARGEREVDWTRLAPFRERVRAQGSNMITHDQTLVLRGC